MVPNFAPHYAIPPDGGPAVEPSDARMGAGGAFNRTNL
jgi:hypothetical protein